MAFTYPPSCKYQFAAKIITCLTIGCCPKHYVMLDLKDSEFKTYFLMASNKLTMDLKTHTRRETTQASYSIH